MTALLRGSGHRVSAREQVIPQVGEADTGSGRGIDKRPSFAPGLWMAVSGMLLR